jgi:MarR family transcriptional repressor of emrRAB
MRDAQYGNAVGTAALENMLGALALAITDSLRAETEGLVGRSGAAAGALATIAQFPDRSVEFLRRAVGLSHSAAVRLVDQLVDDGLVLRRPSGRGPAVSLTPTEAGRSRARAILGRRKEVLAHALAPLSADEADALAAMLDKVLAQVAADPGTTVCRLCNQQQCRARGCPVVQRQAELGAPPPPATPV